MPDVPNPENGLLPNAGVGQSTAPGHANGLGESPESRRKRQIETLKKDIEKRDRRIEHEQRKKEIALSRLEKLERAGKQ